MGQSNNKASLSKDGYACDCGQFVELMQLILDDEASDEQLKFFHDHMDDCRGCLSHYEGEKNMIDQIRLKLERKCCPDSLKSAILDKIHAI